MQMNRQNKLIQTLLSTVLCATAFVSVVQQPAMAYVSDPVTIHELELQRRDLLMKETSLMRDSGELNRQIDTLKMNTDMGSRRRVFDLMNILDQNYRDLAKTRDDIRNVERNLT